MAVNTSPPNKQAKALAQALVSPGHALLAETADAISPSCEVTNGGLGIATTTAANDRPATHDDQTARGYDHRVKQEPTRDKRE